jgi:hypothetical protein
MKQMIIYSMVVAAALGATSLIGAEHSKDCKGVHGKVTVVTEDGVTVNDKLYKVGKTTRITKGDKVVKLEKISAGDVVCLDTRGKDDVALNGEVAALTVLSPNDPTTTKEKEYVREKEKVKEEIREVK